MTAAEGKRENSMISSEVPITRVNREKNSQAATGQ